MSQECREMSQECRDVVSCRARSLEFTKRQQSRQLRSRQLRSTLRHYNRIPPDCGVGGVPLPVPGVPGRPGVVTRTIRGFFLTRNEPDGDACCCTDLGRARRLRPAVNSTRHDSISWFNTYDTMYDTCTVSHPLASQRTCCYIGTKLLKRTICRSISTLCAAAAASTLSSGRVHAS